MSSIDLKERALAFDNIYGEAVASVPDLHRAQSCSWYASESQNTFAGRAANDVEANVVLDVVRKFKNDFGRVIFGGLVSSFRAFIKESNNSLGERSWNQN